MALFGASTYSVMELYGGEDFVTTVTAKENGVPIDITDVDNMSFMVRRSPFYDKDVHSFTVTKMIPYTDGTFQVMYSSSQTSTMKSGRYVFDFFADLPVSGGSKRRTKIAEGIIVVYPSAQATGYYPF